MIKEINLLFIITEIGKIELLVSILLVLEKHPGSH